MVNATGKHRPKKRHHGDGTVVKLTDAWRREPWVWKLRRTVDGKRVTLASCSGTSRAAVEAEAKRILADMDRSSSSDATAVTVADQLDSWLASVRAGGAVKPTTYERYRSTVKRLKPDFEDITLADLDRESTQARIKGTPSQQEVGLLTLRMALKHAIPRLIRTDPTKGVRTARKIVREAPTVDADTARRIAAACVGAEYGPFVMLAMSTGLRRGELLALRWQDVDLDAGVLNVRWSLMPVPAEFREKDDPKVRPDTPKSKRSVRLVPLAASALDALRNQKEAQATARKAAKVWAENDLVFTNEHGEPILPKTATRRAEALVRTVVPGMRLHDLRAAWETLLASGGAADYVRMKLAGHASTAQTLDYTKVIPEDARRAVGAVDRALGR